MRGGGHKPSLGLSHHLERRRHRLCNQRRCSGRHRGGWSWTPVKNLTFSAEVMWFHLHQKMTGAINIQPGATSPKPLATYEFKDQDAVSLNVRVQHNF